MTNYIVKVLSWGCDLVYGFLLLGLCAHWMGFSWNVTSSAPIGIYRRTQEPLTRGQLVYFCLPTEQAKFGWERGYISKMPWWLLMHDCLGGYQPLLKHVGAVEGDIVAVMPDMVRVENVAIANSATRPYDTQGRELPHVAWGQYQLAPGELWMLSTYAPNSWDSRYYGPISSGQVLGTAQPWLVWDTAEAGQ